MKKNLLGILIVVALVACNRPAAGGGGAAGGDSAEGTPAAAAAAQPTGPPVSETVNADEKRPEKVPEGASYAVFAGGCFWCVEAVFEELDGVYEAVSGYSGDTAETADYKLVATGMTQHAEAVKIYYDPEKISFQTLLEVHFVTHDPTTLDRQGNDVGPQYRSAIFYANEGERAAAAAYIEELKASGVDVVTTLEPLEAFYVAEDYHQNYVCENPMQGYVRGVALPKVEKVRKKFKKRLKAQSPITL